MYNANTEAPDKDERILEALLEKARAHRCSQHVFTSKLSLIQRELRKKRMYFLGSSVPLTNIVWKNGALDKKSVDVLAEYLSIRTVELWERPYDDALQFCREFFELSIIAVADPYLEGQCVDNIIRLANFLSHEGKLAFNYAMTDLLPKLFHDRLAAFLDRIEGERCVATFEDAVLGAVAILLGVLEDPFTDEEEG